MDPLSFNLVMAGGASLGAFHGGALAALLTGLRGPAREGHVRIDAMGGTSAGAIAALLAAHSWLEGIDPVWMMEQAWVERVSATLLRSRDDRAPFSFERLDQQLDQLLEPEADGVRVHAADAPLGLHVNLLNLHGLSYQLPNAGDDRGTTYDDWAAFILHPGGGVDQMRSPAGSSPLDAALASAANPAAFAPRSLDRSRHAEVYARNGIDLADDGVYWYSDGGPLSTEPVGKVVGIGRRTADGQARGGRIAVVMDPRSEGPTDQAFVGAEPAPSWLSALVRVLGILPAQAVSTDLRRIGKHNDRLQAVDGLATALEDAIGSDLRAALVAAVNGSPLVGDAPDEREPLPADAGVRDVLAVLAGVDDKDPLACEQISPRVLDPDADTGALLSGELLGDFAGFVDRRLRRNDFLLGWECATTWMDRRLVDLGLEETVSAEVLAAVARARPNGELDLELSERGVLSTLGPMAVTGSRMVADGVLGYLRRHLPMPSLGR